MLAALRAHVSFVKPASLADRSETVFPFDSSLAISIQESIPRHTNNTNDTTGVGTY